MDFKCELNYKVASHRDGIQRPKVVTYWLGEMIDPVNGKVKMSNEHQDYRWLPLKQAMELSGYNDFNECLQKCEAKIQSVIHAI